MRMETSRMNDFQISNDAYVYIRDFTGNPFVDAGIAALCVLTGKKDSKQILKADLAVAIQQITEFYLEGNEIRWQNLGKLFTINCILLNPSNRENRRRKYEEYLRELIQKVGSASSSGNCIACGARDAQPLLHSDVYRYPYREEYPLTGSGDMLNYFSFFERGMPLCPLCTILLQFVPLYLISNNKQLFLVHSHNPKIMLSLAKEALVSIKKESAAGANLRFYQPFRFSSINECVVRIARYLIEKAAPYGEIYGQTAIRLYSFVNSGQVNMLDFIDLPTDVFVFLEGTRLGGMNRNLDELFEESVGITKNGRDIYSCIVNEEDISHPFFLRKRERRIVGGWKLLESYLLQVKKMEREKLEVIKKVGRRLYDHLKATNFKKLRDLEAEEYQEFKLALERFQKEKLIYEIDDLPLLFPRDEKGRVFWRETQSILLGYIYELMHKEAKEVKT